MDVRLADRQRWREAWQHTSWLVAAHNGFKTKPWDIFPAAFPVQDDGMSDSGLTQQEHEAAAAAMEKRMAKAARRNAKKEQEQ